MKRELQVDELAPYLPYGLNIVGRDLADIKELDSINMTSVNIKGRDTTYGMWADVSDIKPLLVPLEDLMQEDLNASEYTVFWGLRQDVLNQSCSHKTFQYLIERHFDVFGLIEQGLAINKLTI